MALFFIPCLSACSTSFLLYGCADLVAQSPALVDARQGAACTTRRCFCHTAHISGHGHAAQISILFCLSDLQQSCRPCPQKYIKILFLMKIKFHSHPLHGYKKNASRVTDSRPWHKNPVKGTYLRYPHRGKGETIGGSITSPSQRLHEGARRHPCSPP